jgi:hypothetical protein
VTFVPGAPGYGGGNGWVTVIGRELIVHAEWGAAQGRLTRIAAVGGLTEVSQDAYEHGLAHLIRAGPFGDLPGVSKLVAVRVLTRSTVRAR